MSREVHQFILGEGQKVAPARRFGFYRWMLRIVAAGYDPRDDLMGDAHGRNV